MPLSWMIFFAKPLPRMDLETLKASGHILFECISGSRAYGLDGPNSDTDIRGVFVLPQDLFYSLETVEQVNNESNDIVYYELRKFVELLSKNNPNILELLAMPDDCILYKHPLYEAFRPADFLSRLCEQSFANYAFTQIKKARGLNKKIVNPMEGRRKSVGDFCVVYVGKETLPLATFLEANGWEESQVGLAVVPHIKDGYNLYIGEGGQYRGVVNKETSNDVVLSSVPKGERPAGLLFFNKDGYSAYCKAYKEYHEWEEKRNEARYQSTIAHAKNYDAKNMMHTFRLLHMAREIATEGVIRVRRPDRDFLLDVKAGKFEYDELLEQAEDIRKSLCQDFERSALPLAPSMTFVNRLLAEVRSGFYAKWAN